MAVMTWWMMAIIVLVVGVGGSVLFSLLRRRAYDASAESGTAGAGASNAARGRPQPVVLARFWAWVAMLFVGVGGVFTAVADLISDRVSLRLEVNNFWPVPLPGFEAQRDAGAATAIDPYMNEVHVQAEGLTMGTRLLLAGGDLLMAIAAGAVILLVIRMCNAILRGTPFTKSLRSGAWATAVVVLIAGFVSQGLSIAGRMRASEEVLGYSGYSYTDSKVNAALGLSDESDSPYLGWPFPGPGGNFEFPFTPFWVAAIIIIVVELINAGVNLAADKARLAKDVEGLV